MEWKDFDTGVFLVYVIGIVFDSKTGKILLNRIENDPIMEKLNWCFPGGNPGYGDELDTYVKHHAERVTGVKAEPKKIIFAKTYSEKRRVLSVYFLCEHVSGEAEAREEAKEVKWVKPTEVAECFATSTSFHPKLREMVEALEKEGQ